MACPTRGSPAASPTVREEQEIKSDYPSIVPQIWPEGTSPPSPMVLHDDYDDEFGQLSMPPSSSPTGSSFPSDYPSSVPSDYPSFVPSDMPSFVPSDMPSFVPSSMPSLSEEPSSLPTILFEAFGNVVIDDAPQGEDSTVDPENHLPETRSKSASRSMKKRRTRSDEKPKKRTKIVRLLRARLEPRGAQKP